VDTLTETFEERLQEIDAYLDLLDALERQVHDGPPRIGGGRTNPVGDEIHQRFEVGQNRSRNITSVHVAFSLLGRAWLLPERFIES